VKAFGGAQAWNRKVDVNKAREGIAGNAEAIFKLVEWEICHTLSAGLGLLGGGSGCWRPKFKVVSS
jgi:hypothetical protein